MIRIDSSAVLHEKINAVLEKSSSLCTNFFLSAEETEKAIAIGLYADMTDAGLILYRKRADFYRVSFYLSDPEANMKLTPDLPAVLEIPYRERDSVLKSAAGVFESAGFSTLFGRIRMTRRGEAVASETEISPAGREQLDAVKAILAACFHPMAGCIPGEDELIDDISAGHILTDREASGLLHFTESRTGSELRHLAVMPEYRNCGIAGALIREYLNLCGGRKSTVWVRDDNEPAIHLYEKYGWKPDGMKSRVLILEK